MESGKYRIKNINDTHEFVKMLIVKTIHATFDAHLIMSRIMDLL